MQNFFAYIRVSTQKQGERGVSLQEQRAAIEAYAKRFGFSIVAWYEERLTAAKRGRPAYSKMLKRLRAGKARGVIIHKIDRSARNLRDWADLGELIDHGIDVRFVSDSVDMHSNSGRLSADVQAVVAAHYIRNLREETRKGLYGRLKQGLYPLRAPIGYLDRGTGQAKVPDPETAPLVQKAFELYATGRFNITNLQAELSRLGLRNKRGGKLSRNGISTMLNNPFYVGIMRLRRTGETFPGHHQPLISTNLYKRVQNVLRGRTHEWVNRHDFLFRRLLRCKICGNLVIGEMQKGHTYYRCHTQWCATKSVREEIVEAAVKSKLEAAELTDNELDVLRDEVAALRQRWRADHTATLEVIRLNQSRIQDRLNRLTDAYVDAGIDKPVFEERRAGLLLERRALDERLAELQQGATPVHDQVVKFLEQANRFCSSYSAASPSLKREFIRNATSNRSVVGKKIEFELRSPYRELANRPKVPLSDPQRDEHRILKELCADLISHFNASQNRPAEEGSGAAEIRYLTEAVNSKKY